MGTEEAQGSGALPRCRTAPSGCLSFSGATQQHRLYGCMLHLFPVPEYSHVVTEKANCILRLYMPNFLLPVHSSVTSKEASFQN